MKEKTKWIRNCPNCGKELSYSCRDTFRRADKNQTECKSCSKLGEKHPMHGMPKEAHPMYGKCGKDNPNYGRTNSAETLQLMSKIKLGELNPFYGKKHTDENIQLFKKLSKGENNPMYGKIHPMRGKHQSVEFCKNQRIRRITEIENNMGQAMPNYNPSSIPIIEAKAKELGITDLQHAENGGEFFVKELGYWVDGYSKEKNIVIEYYEPFHNKQEKRDKRREKEITDYLGCKFIIIKE